MAPGKPEAGGYRPTLPPLSTPDFPAAKGRFLQAFPAISSRRKIA